MLCTTDQAREIIAAAESPMAVFATFDVGLSYEVVFGRTAEATARAKREPDSYAGEFFGADGLVEFDKYHEMVWR